MAHLKSLVENARPGDHFVFHCKSYELPFLIFFFYFTFLRPSVSGHGSQIECENGKEADGFDEGMPSRLLIYIVQYTNPLSPVIWPSDVVYDPSEDDEHKRATNFIQDDVRSLVSIKTCAYQLTTIRLPQDLKKILVDDLPDYSRLTVRLFF